MKYFIGLVLLLVAIGGYVYSNPEALAELQKVIPGLQNLTPAPPPNPDSVAPVPAPTPAPVVQAKPTPVPAPVCTPAPVVVAAVVVPVSTPTPAPVWAAPVNPVYPSEWTTTDGQKYSQVKVTLMEADAITIMHKDGIALVEMTSLPPDLQKTFNYIPYCADLAAQKRKASEQSDQQALADETARSQAQQAALAVTPSPNPAALNAANDRANRIAQLRSQIASLIAQADSADAAARAAWDAQRQDGYGNRSIGGGHVTTFSGSSDLGDQLRAQARSLQAQLNAM